MLDLVLEYYIFLILLCSCVNCAIFFERFTVLYRFQKSNFLYLRAFLSEMQGSCFARGRQICEKLNLSFARDVAVGRLLFDSACNYGKKNPLYQVDEFIALESPKLEMRMSLLSTITSVLPLLGILGTVLGIINALPHLGNDSSVQNTKSLWEAVWFALSSTAFALIVAIPSMFAYNYLLSKIESIFFYIKSEFVSFMKSLEYAEDE